MLLLSPHCACSHPCGVVYSMLLCPWEPSESTAPLGTISTQCMFPKGLWNHSIMQTGHLLISSTGSHTSYHPSFFHIPPGKHSRLFQSQFSSLFIQLFFLLYFLYTGACFIWQLINIVSNSEFILTYFFSLYFHLL